ncbi:MAG: ribbon-helix-helix protein, CopG family [Deltaproteobacteria bacterium]|nr:ribbon-helix-helix protein, CopG family [Deltaproteobacteria bacterium]
MTNRTLAVRLDPPLQRDLGAIARRQKRSKSDVVREAIRRYLESDALAAEARKQSLRVSRGRGEADALEFLEHAADWSE